MPLRFFSRRIRSAPGRPLPRGRRRRRALRIAVVALLTIIGLLVASTAANLVLEGVERSNAAAYGEKVRIDQGTINVSRSGDTGPTIVLLSGLGTPAPGLDFAPLVRELTGFRVVAVEGFGYGHSDMTARPRTIENMSEELHTVLSQLAVDRPYILAGHSIAGFTTLYYANKYPAEVSAVIGIDPTVPAGMASDVGPAHTEAPAAGNFWERLPSTTGLVRWAAALGLADPAGDNYTQEERGQMRMLASWNYGNEALTDETNRMAENAAKIRTLSYPDHVPVLQFLSRETISQQPEWLGSHERQLENVKRRELVLLDGNHYLHWTQSQAMATKIAEFLSPAGTVP